MSADPQSSSATVTVDVHLSAGSWELNGKLPVPKAPTRLRHMLPVIQSLADGIVDLAVKATEGKGEKISCKKGCGACCRQLVPISEVEARRIAELVNELPEPRRSQIRARFAAARRRLEESGLLEKILRRDAWSAEDFQRLGLEYFYLGIPCPFLEEESCSIHPDRPITCREYLVTSPAENCARPTPQGIRWVPLPVKVWTAVARFDPTPPSARFLRWVPLILAPEWAEANPDELPPRPGVDWMRELFARLSAKEKPAVPPPPFHQENASEK
jgi:Fe-S-cluster containining protein